MPVSTAVLGALAAMVLCQLRLSAEDAAVRTSAGAATPMALAAVESSTPTPAEPAPLVTQKAPSATPAQDALSASAEAGRPGRSRLREGTQFNNALGKFRQNGDAVSFVDENGREIGGLPNLNLERITRMLKTVDEPEGIWWSVSGTITEFAGHNYILITRAVYKATAPPPTPDRIGE
jgi:hypothetical protein